MYRCENSMISFHPKIKIDELIDEDGNENLSMRNKAISELKSRITYMVHKMQVLMNGKEKTLFLVKVKDEGNEMNCEYARELTSTINVLYKSKNYKIVLVFESIAKTDELDQCENNHLAIRYVLRFADDSKTDTDSDWKGWLSIFQEYATCDEKEYYERIRKRINNKY